MNSCLPAIKPSLPSLCSPQRYSTSMNSSAGRAISATLPDSASRTSGTPSPTATPSIMPSWQWWPQAWAASVSGSAWGCPSTRRESSSPMTATVGPGLPPRRYPLTPVSAMPVSWAMPSSVSLRLTMAEVLTSWKPGSGFSRTVLATSMSHSLRSSMAAWTFAFRSSGVYIGAFLCRCLRWRSSTPLDALLREGILLEHPAHQR